MHKHLIWLFFLFLLPAMPAKATHLVGGSLTYTSLGKSNGYLVYKVKLIMYRDCKNSSVGFDWDTKLAIYENNSNKSLLRVKTFNFKGENLATPPAGTGNCTFNPNVCLSEGYYEDTIMLASSTAGYHLYNFRCCRNAPLNLADNQGQTYYSFIPSTDISNSSPYFSGVPAPYICANDDATIFNLATDADGDSLVYSIIRPLHGGSQSQPAMDVAPTALPNPLPLVSYATGYSVTRPFGNGSSAKIDQHTGLTTLKSLSGGHYALAVEVKEYRNGTYIGSTIRDVQIIVLNCPPNPLPKLIAPNNATPVVAYQVEAGDLLKFNIMVSDTDSMYLSGKGALFSTVPGQRATLEKVAGKDTIVSQFSWQTACEHGSKTPYIFTVQVQDNGCPSKTLNLTYSITVIPHDPEGNINGPDTLCAYTKNITYSTKEGPTSTTWNWMINNGSITGPTNQSMVKTNFAEAGSGYLKMVATSKFGCVSDTFVKNIYVWPLPNADAGADKTFCSADTIIIGPQTLVPSYKYQWLSTTGISKKNSANPELTLVNPVTFPMVSDYRLQVSDQYCTNYDTMQVTVYPRPKTLSFTGDDDVCYQSSGNYSVKRNAGSTYNWWAEDAKILSGNGSNSVDVKWHTAGINKLLVTETNNFGCVGDTSVLQVNVLKASADTIMGSEVVCPNSSMVDYWVNATAGSKYYWEAMGGTIASGGNSDAIKINWGDSALAYIKVVEVNSIGCIGDTVFYPVTISYKLRTKPIQGPAQICELVKGVEYQVQETNGSHYSWLVNGGTLSQGNGTGAIAVNWGAAGNGELSVLETSEDVVNGLMCIGDTVKLQVKINPVPKTSQITGPKDICALTENEYKVSGFATSTYMWSISSDHPFIGNETNTINVTWQEPGIYVITVYEVSEDSCVGEPRQLTVQVYSVPETTEIKGPDIVCAPEHEEIAYSVEGLENSNFNWMVTKGAVANGQGTEDVTINWFPAGTGTIAVLETSDFGCAGDTVTKTVTIDAPELNMQLVTTKQEDENVISIEWEIENGFNLTGPVNLYKRADVVPDWALSESLPKSIIKTEDADVKTGKASYNYILQTLNLCNKIVESRPHNSILLQGTKQDKGIVALNWNSYHGWENGVSYQVMRRLNERPGYEVFYTTDDTATNKDVGIDGYEQCYRIKAVNKAEPQLASWSNEICFAFDAVVWVPNAFTPGGTPGLNDYFVIEAGNFRTLELKIYNRWGECIFHNKNLTQNWDGTYRGQPVPAGVYTYSMSVENSREEKVYRGTITLIR